MKFLVLMVALAMPSVAWMSNRGLFGPDNGTLSDRYPTLLVAAGYAFAIWGLIFLLDVAFAAWQAGRRRESAAIARIRPWVAAGFGLTASWMIIFSQQWFGVALLVIWSALACILWAAVSLASQPLARGEFWLALLPLGLHAGWLSLAAFLNTAQVVVAYELLPTVGMLAWSLALWAAALVLLLWVNTRLRGNLAYAAAALWGLVGVYVKQSRSDLAGADTSAWVALALASVLVVQTLYLLARRRHEVRSHDKVFA